MRRCSTAKTSRAKGHYVIASVSNDVQEGSAGSTRDPERGIESFCGTVLIWMDPARNG
jgi:hypothetical protein